MAGLVCLSAFLFGCKKPSSPSVLTSFFFCVSVLTSFSYKEFYNFWNFLFLPILLDKDPPTCYHFTLIKGSLKDPVFTYRHIQPWPAWLRWLAASHRLRGCWLQSWAGHMPRLQGGMLAGDSHRCFSPSASFSLPLSLK